MGPRTLHYQRKLSVAKQSPKKEIHVRLGEFFLFNGARDVVPLVQPVDNSQKREGRQTRWNQSRSPGFLLHLGDEIFQKTNVGSLARVDFSPQSAFERPVLVQDDGDLQISRADNQVDMTGNGLSQLFA